MIGIASAPLYADIVVPVRTEPRSFFANERTLLLWMELASALAVVGSALATPGQAFAVQVAGLCLSLPAGAFVLYATRMYFLRQSSLVFKRPMHFEDTHGTFAICIFVTALVLANMAHGFTRFFHMGVVDVVFTGFPIINASTAQ